MIFTRGAEEIFKLIQTQLDRDDLKQRDEWHELLLERMTESIDGVRPAVISEELFRAVNGLLCFPPRLSKCLWLRT
jgi:hypothetical protein